jgi:hypothetical protein
LGDEITEVDKGLLLDIVLIDGRAGGGQVSGAASGGGDAPRDEFGVAQVEGIARQPVTGASYEGEVIIAHWFVVKWLYQLGIPPDSR